MTDLEVWNGYRKAARRPLWDRLWPAHPSRTPEGVARVQASIHDGNTRIGVDPAIPDFIDEAQLNRFVFALVTKYGKKPLQYAIHCYVQGARRSTVEAARAASQGADTETAIRAGYAGAHTWMFRRDSRIGCEGGHHDCHHTVTDQGSR